MNARALVKAPHYFTLEHAGQPITYVLRHSDKARRHRIKVSLAGVEVIAPKASQTQFAHAFITENADWVLKQMDMLRQRGELRRTQQPKPGPDTLLFLGHEMRLCVTTEPTERVYGRVEHSANQITVILPAGQNIDAAQTLEGWLRRQARMQFEARVQVRTAEMRVRPERLFVMGQRTRWGSCSAKHNLSLNWRLVLAPPEVLDYVVVHELAHLHEFNHSQKFWLVVRSFCPEFERHKRWLKDNEGRLRLPLFQSPALAKG